MIDMDNEVFRKTYRAINERFCPFEKSILTNNCGCSRGRRFCIAEREGINCGSDAALPHAKAMRVQVGGLRGLYAVVMPAASVPETIADIHGIIEAALDHFHTLADLPYQPIIRQIAAYQGRRTRRPR